MEKETVKRRLSLANEVIALLVAEIARQKSFQTKR